MSEMDLLEKTTREFIRRDLGPEFSQTIARARQAGFLEIGNLAELCRVLQNVAEFDAGFASVIFAQHAAREILGENHERLTGFPIFQDPARETAGLSAEPCADRFQLSGECAFVVVAPGSEQFLLPARMEGQPGFSYFLVDAGSGVTATPVATLGLRSCRVVDLRLQSAKASRIDMAGSAAFTKMSARMNIAVAAMILGVLRPGLKVALDYSLERVQGGRKILDWPAHRMMLAGLVAQLRVAEAALTEALRASSEGRADREVLALSTAIHFQEIAAECSSNALRALGGVGYMKDFPQERYFREAHCLALLLGSASLKKLRLMELVTAESTVERNA